MMFTLSEWIGNTRNLIALLAAVAAVATVLTLAMPLLQSDTLNKRMRAVSVEREKIRQRERERIARGEKEKIALRQVIAILAERLFRHS